MDDGQEDAMRQSGIVWEQKGSAHEKLGNIGEIVPFCENRMKIREMAENVFFSGGIRR